LSSKERGEKNELSTFIIAKHLVDELWQERGINQPVSANIFLNKCACDDDNLEEDSPSLIMHADKSFSSLTECCGKRQTHDSVRVRLGEGNLTVQKVDKLNDNFFHDFLSFSRGKQSEEFKISS
jgi:hypothetical protein